jgi:hypothetical protein
VPVTTSGLRSVFPPGQYIVKRPGFKVSEKCPERPGATFSTSPRMWSPSRISNSVTASAPSLATSKVVGPAARRSSAGSHPASVSLTSTERPLADF